MYKHYSFDLWLTLIKSNPDFKEKRAVFFYENYNFFNKTLEEVIQIFRQIDVCCNSINEKTGKNIDSEEMYLLVISQINDYKIDFNSIDIEKLYQKMEDIVLGNLPFLYSSKTIEVLKELKTNPDVTMSILSNTAFIKGSTLRKVLDFLKLSKFFEFQLYSDELGFSKPNKQFFEVMLSQVAHFRSNNDVTLEQIIHIGDNPKADIEGANLIGIHSLLINSNQNTISNLIQL